MVDLPHHSGPFGDHVDLEKVAQVFDGAGVLEDPYVVKFVGGDKENPMHWANGRKWGITSTISIATLCVAFGSSIFAGGIAPMVVYFQKSSEVMTLGVSLYVLGFASGPLVWAPLSEIYGRRPVFVASFWPFVLFSFGAGGTKSIEALLICRFFAGLFGSSALTNSGGVVSDMFNAQERALALSLFAVAPFLGPVLGPMLGGFIGEYSSWKTLFWVQGAFGAVMGLLGSFIPETYAPVLLRKKASKLSKETGRVYISEFDVRLGAKQPLAEKLRVNMTRPFILLFKEPIVLLFSIYAAIVYGTLYMCFGAFPIVFQKGRGWGPGVGGLAFIGVGIGMIIGVGISIWENKRYVRMSIAAGGRLAPEARLTMTCVGGCLLPISLFWFAWTVQPSVHWIVPIIASTPFGTGMLLVFLSMTSYLIDSYLMFAASALAANAVLRSLFGAAFPMFTARLFEALGNNWALTLFAFLALACAPIPFAFIKWGAQLRALSTFAPGHHAPAPKLERVPTRLEREVEEEVREADQVEAEEEAEEAREIAARKLEK